MRHLLRSFTGSPAAKLLSAALLVAASVQLASACASYRLRYVYEEGNQTICRLQGSVRSPDGQTTCLYNCYTPVFH